MGRMTQTPLDSASTDPAAARRTDLPIVAHGDPAGEVTLDHDGALIRRSVLPGGVRVLTEAMPGQRSSAVGAWVAVGSRDESDGHFGSTHFLEHLLFKGTPTRSALDIAQAFDTVGGEANAATGKEHTAYYARVLDVDLPMAIETIGDMVTSSLLDPREYETERGVILEELAAADDDPGDVVHERFATAVLGHHPLGRPIGGTSQTIRAVPREAVLEHYRSTYGASSLVVTAAGSVEHEDVCARVLGALETGGWATPSGATPHPRRLGPAKVGPGSPMPLGDLPGTRAAVARTTEQAHVVLGCQGLVVGDPRRHTLSVLATILGGGMSSRLFQEVRERRGLAYTTYAFASAYAEAGTFGMYAACNPANLEELVRVFRGELEELASNGVPDDELARGIGQLRGSLVLGLEDNGSRMSRLGRSEIIHGHLQTVDDLVTSISEVTADGVRQLAAELAARPRSLVVVGPAGQDVVDGVDLG